MKYTVKKTLAFLLTLMMLVNAFPLSAFAGKGPDTGVRNPPLTKTAGDNTCTASFTLSGGLTAIDRNGLDGPNFFIIAYDANSAIKGYAQIADNIEELSFYECDSNSRTISICRDYTFQIAKSGDSMIGYTTPNGAVSNGGIIDGIQFNWEYNETTKIYQFTAAPEPNVNVTVNYEGTKGLTLTDTYYLVAGSPITDPQIPYQKKELTSANANGTHGFTVSSLPDDASHFYVLLKGYGTEDNPDAWDTEDNKEVVWNGSTGPVDIENGEYKAVWAGPTVSEGKLYYTITISDKKSIIIDFKNKDGADDNNASLNGKYYIVFSYQDDHYLSHSGFGKINISGSKATISQFADLTSGSTESILTIPGNCQNITINKIVKYSGDGELTKEYYNAWQNYDPTGNLTTVAQNSGDSVDLYTLTWNGSEGTDHNFHITATKKDVYPITISTWNIKGDELEDPDESFGSGYYVRVAVKNKTTQEIVGWNMVPVTWSGTSETTVYLADFVGINDCPNTSQNKTAYNSNDYDIVLEGAYPIRLCKIKNTNSWPQKLSDAQNTDHDPNTKIDDSMPAGYASIGVVADQSAANIKMKKANAVKYHVRLKFDTTKLSDISVAGGLYVRVTVGHKSNTEGAGDYYTYGFVPVTNAMTKIVDTDNGYTYIDVPIDTWLNADGSEAASQNYTGFEKSTTVELVGVPSSNTNPKPTEGDKLYVDPNRPWYVNKFALTHYPTSGEEPDRIKILNKEPNTDYWYDVVELTQDKTPSPAYNLEYILNGYNVVALCADTEGEPGQGDVVLTTHQMGGVLIRGDLIVTGGSGVADSKNADKPSAVGGKITGTGFSANYAVSARQKNHDIVPFYLGSGENTVIGRVYNGMLIAREGQLDNGTPDPNSEADYSDPPPAPTPGVYPGSSFQFGLNRAGSTLISDNYIVWSQLQTAIINQSEALAEEALDLAAVDPDTYLIEYVPGTTTYDVNVGDNVVFSGLPEDIVVTINVKGTTEHPDPKSPTAPGTVVNFLEDQNYRIPKITIDSEQQHTKETGEGMSIVFNYPYCSIDKTISDCGDEQFGHVVAPKATIHIEGGNYSGCMVGNNAYIDNEGHLYPYRGNTLIGFYGDIQATKKVNGEDPTSRQKYSFTIKRLRKSLTQTQYNDSDYWDELNTVENTGSDVTFPDVPFYSAGKYYFLIYEDISNPDVNDILDGTKYLIECEVDKDHQGNLHMKPDSLKYYVIKTDDPDDLITAAANPAGNGKHPTSIDLTDSTKIVLVSALTWQPAPPNSSENGEISTGIVFQNQKLKSGLNIKKEVTGDPDTDPEFAFTLYLWNGGDGEEAYIDRADNVLTVKKYSSSGAESSVSLTLTDTENAYDNHKATVATFTLKKNEVLNITGILVGTHYAVKENVNDNKEPVNGSDTITGYTLLSVGNNTTDPENGVHGTIQQNTSSSVIIVFTNEYTETNTTQGLEIKKAVTGTNAPTTLVDGTFTFQVTSKSAPTGVTAPAFADASNVGNTVSFTAVTFNAAGDYVYEISEKSIDATKMPGFATVSTDKLYAKIVIGKEGATYSVTSVKYYSDEGCTTEVQNDNIKITNEYIQPVGSANIPVKKIVAGNDYTGSDKFEFELSAVSAADLQSTAITGDALPTLSKSRLLIEKDDTDSFSITNYTVPGTYTYKVREVDGRVTGMTYDNVDKTITVTVAYSDDRQSLVATVKQGDNVITDATPLIITNTYSMDSAIICVKKIVDGTNAPDEPFHFTLSKRDQTTSDEMSAPLAVDLKADETGTFGEIVYTQAGTYEYTIAETEGTIPGMTYASATAVTVTVTDDGTGKLTAEVDYEPGKTSVEITNTFERIMTFVSVKKVWNDDGNRDGLRPPTLEVKLLADDAETGKSVILSTANNWTGRIDDIPKFRADGITEIVYTWAEDSVYGYEPDGTTKSGALTIMTNKHTPETVSVSVRKVWVDDGTHPKEVKVQLFADGKATGDTAILNEANGWKYSWDDLCKNVTESGLTREIEYTVAETEIPEGYVAKITGSASAGFVITNTLPGGNLAIQKQFDILEPEENPEEDEMKTEIEVVKYWDDQDNKDGNRPESITVHLFAGGEEVKTATLNAQNGWKKKWGDLPKFVDGHPIHYSVTEDPVQWYVPEIHGFTITNHYRPETTSVIVRKVWHDEGHENMRPTSIAVKLSNGMAVVLNEMNGWTGVISGLPTYVNGKPAVYTWSEPEVIGYTQESVTVKGNTTEITNKIWQRDEKPEKGKKPKVPGDGLTLIDEYDTPLGVEVVINHVGDCFD